MDILRNLFGFPESSANPAQQNASPLPTPAPIHRRVLAIIHNPVFRSRRGQKAKQVFGWNDPDRLAQEYIADIRACSAGYANFEITERIEVDGFPVKRDGFVYTEASFLEAWQSRRFHDPDGVDYLRLVRDFNIIQKIDSGAIDEVWLLGFPYCGYYESIMAGSGSDCAQPPPPHGSPGHPPPLLPFGFHASRRGVGKIRE